MALIGCLMFKLNDSALFLEMDKHLHFLCVCPIQTDHRYEHEPEV